MEIKDYLHFYIGCDVMDLFNDRINKLVGVDNDTEMPVKTVWNGKGRWALPYTEVKPILRKLSDMTEEECHKYGIAYLNGEYTKDCFEADATYGTTFKVYGIKSLSERVIQMCKDGWDVFGLIPAGLAIDKTSLKN